MIKCTLVNLSAESPLRVLCLGAHPDDLEIGCGGTILKLAEGKIPFDVTWVVFSGNDERRREATDSANVFLTQAARREVIVREFQDGFFPYTGGEIKEYFEVLKKRVAADLIFTHYRHDLHQDHRVISELTWNTFRNHLILEYEIPKYDGDMGSPNAFVELDESTSRRKIDTILAFFQTQERRHWFSEDLFLSILRLRGMECAAPSGYAEAFYCRKMVLRVEGGMIQTA
jgi:LmbE family N-acetylglucosaminyl deacetylase